MIKVAYKVFEESNQVLLKVLEMSKDVDYECEIDLEYISLELKIDKQYTPLLIDKKLYLGMCKNQLVLLNLYNEKDVNNFIIKLKSICNEINKEKNIEKYSESGIEFDLINE